MIDLTNLTIQKIKASLLEKKFSATDLTLSYLARIKLIDPTIKAFITVTDKQALLQAKAIDDKIAKGQKLGKLAGSCMAVKDIYLTKDIQTTAGSQLLNGYIPQYSSTIYQKLLDQDAIIIGKTNTDCFAFGGSTENSGYFTTKNPWNTDMVPGGSSGGSAAAQISNLCTFSLGTDTGGSIRQPASLCGVTGLKPTYGRNSRYGITAMASSFDAPGAFASNCQDLATVLSQTAGFDPFDATSSQIEVPDYINLLDRVSLKGLRIGLPKQYFEGLEPDVKARLEESVNIFEKQAAKIVPISLPNTNLGIDVYYVLVPCEISANMARYDGLRFGQSAKHEDNLVDLYFKTRGKFMEPELKRRILIGTYFLSSGYYDAYYLKASKVRTIIKEEFQKEFTKVDLMLAPVSPTTAWPIGQKVNDPLQMYLADVLTVPINVAGLPALSLPCGFDSQGLPVGLQLIGNYFTEDKLLSVGHQFQQITSFHLQKPKL